MSELSLSEKVKEYFISLGLKPGDKVEAEVELCERFGVTRHQMRKVLNVMVHAGVLERLKKRGTIVRSFDVNSLTDHIKFQFEAAQFDINEFKEARVVVERAILPLAVKRMTPTMLGKIEQCVQNMLDHIDEPEIADQFDRDFHLLLFQACGNQVLEAFSGVLASLFSSADYRRKYWNEGHVRRIADEHQRIVDAIKSADVERAVQALDQHLNRSQRQQSQQTD